MIFAATSLLDSSLRSNDLNNIRFCVFCVFRG